MPTLIMNVIFIVLSFWSLTTAQQLCDVCVCEREPKFVYGESRSVADCTSKGFTTANTTLLETLPDDIQVLLFRNNHLPSLPANLFGSDKNFTNLTMIDMSSNEIVNVKGKAFHHVPSVELLILNHNSISLDNYTHPRMFSNMENLKELHLTNAFLGYESRNSRTFASQLHDVFVNSNIIKLEKLHLEQNEIANFSDVRVFCNLKNLLDLHLGNNILSGLHFHIDCLPRLRFLDLEGNKIQTFTKDELAKFDTLPARNQSLMIDISKNPLICDCEMNLYSWLQTTKVNVRQNSTIRCNKTDKDGGEMLLKDFDMLVCAKAKQLMLYDGDHTTNGFANFVILLVLCVLFVILLYFSARYSINYFRYSSVSSGKVHYVVIKNFDENRDVCV